MARETKESDMARSSIRNELDKLRAELEALKAAKRPPEPPPAAAAPADEGSEPTSLDDQIRHLAGLAEDLLHEAEETVATHPAASLAAALVIGIAIGRLTAR
jgi:ElaB/YqjD/DUF883 family membrane-anchored ribosome-binding protein